ncbi:Protein-glutamate methylesterase/protein-glutamine glutaminase (plasmid) [Asticcacaulis sp. MM231]|uniref:chemotaxis protein CheB n=1 Tax=Asticcacaulis sp. MM231 TaxID=3157666 RepID=UPI0032D59FBD
MIAVVTPPEPAHPLPKEAGIQMPRVQPATRSGFPIVGIGASAGGLEACRKLFAALPADTGMAFILVQHLEPNHESLMVELLTGHTVLQVSQASEGASIEPGHLYIIPPGTYLSVSKGSLKITPPAQPHGLRLPFDFLLHAMAEDLGSRAIGVVLSGTGADGSAELKALRDAGGYVIAQDPEEAGFGGMPRSAILTECVDEVLKIADIPAALVKRALHLRDGATSSPKALPKPERKADPKADAIESVEGFDGPLAEIVDLLRQNTAHDFTLYKPGTLQRRTERRMTMAGIADADMPRYLDFLRHDAGEVDLLANDLLINVTGFFRDPKVFDYLASKIAPELIAKQPIDLPLRIWIAGCSTGEEAYSIAMIFREAMDAAKSALTLQIFASDVDPDAVANAREGLYPGSIRSEVSADRLARFFSKEGDHFRVSIELRGHVVFTVQDVLSDPPFSRLDLISCRNLLIYLKPEAQAKVVALFHFALRDHGMLLLGTSETVGSAENRFSVISKTERLYRHVGRSQPGDLAFGLGKSDGPAVLKPRTNDQAPTRPAALADLARKTVMERFAPTSVLINEKNECLHFTGATDRYLTMPSGLAVYDILSLARDAVRTKLRSALQQAIHEKKAVTVKGGRINQAETDFGFNIDILPVENDGERLLLVCFIEVPSTSPPAKSMDATLDPSRVTELEMELKSTRTELSAAIRNLEISGEEQKAINEEALSVNEEFQSTNEEMLTSKEELQSLNEELTALNTQLQETLERQRTTSNDLQNVLYSTDLATLFLDRDLKIRFFTPATRLLFSVIPGDVGRPLADLRSLASDADLLKESEHVLKTLQPVEREIEAGTGAWYIRRILPYRVPGDGVEGVVITFADITERRKAAVALEAAKQEAQLANIGKSRFLAAASHDLRQPLQSLKLIQGLLQRSVEGEKSLKLVGRFEDILAAITGMLNALLDINQIEAGTVHAEPLAFPINDLLNRVRGEFVYHAQAQRLELVVMPCSAYVVSDPRLLEQMVRNLLNNALKYTKAGKISRRLPQTCPNVDNRDIRHGHRYPRGSARVDFQRIRTAR